MENNLLHSLNNFQDDIFYMDNMTVVKELNKIIESCYFNYSKTLDKNCYAFLVEFKQKALNNTDEENDLQLYKFLKKEGFRLEEIKTKSNYYYDK